MLTIQQNEITDKKIISEEGSNSKVYKAQWDKKAIVIKEFDIDCKYNFENEVSIMSKLEHPYVMSILATLSDSIQPSFVMDYMPNGTLTEYLDGKDGWWSDRDKIDMARRIGRGLAYLHHNRILHLDLKTDNILIDADEKPKITDFDNSGELIYYHLQDTHTSDYSKGTPRWHTPEALENINILNYESHKYTSGTDVYAYALIIWALYSLKKPYQEIDDRQVLDAKISAGEHEDETQITEPSVQKLCVRAWSLTPKERPKADDFVFELSRLTYW